MMFTAVSLFGELDMVSKYTAQDEMTKSGEAASYSHCRTKTPIFSTDVGSIFSIDVSH